MLGRTPPGRVGMLIGEVLRRGWDQVGRLATIYSGDPRSRRFHAFGEGSCIVFPSAAILGDDRIAVGADTMVGPYTTLSAGLPLQPPNPSWAGPTLTIGDRCVIGRNVTITAHQEIVIGDDVWTGNEVFISDQNHAWDDPDRPIGEQGSVPLPVRIGDGTWIGAGAKILPGASLGARVVVAAGAVVTAPVPDGAIVAGVPARVVGSTGPGEVVVPILTEPLAPDVSA